MSLLSIAYMSLYCDVLYVYKEKKIFQAHLEIFFFSSLYKKTEKLI